MSSDVTPTTTLVDGVPDTGKDAPRSDDDLAPPPDPAPCVVRVEGVGKCYHIYDRPQDRLKQAFFRWRRTYHREFWALRDVSFEVGRGEAVGIVGRNGSGKSTLLQIIAGTLTPTTGSVHVAGRVAALLELGSGFNHDFTGRENVYLNGAVLGLSKREIDDRFDAIAGFADIGDFLDQPVKTYSSGMLVRLAFAVQVQLEPDLLIVDEALAVGDALFQKRCYQRLEELRSGGVTILFVSHDQESVRTLTSRAVLLHHGSVRAMGTAAEVVLDYRRLLHDEERAYFQHAADRLRRPAPRPAPAVAPAVGADVDASHARSDRLSFGALEAEVVDVRVTGAHGEEKTLFYPGEPIRIEIACMLHRDLDHLNIAFRLRNKQGVKVTSWGTLNDDIRNWSRAEGRPATWDRSFRKGQVVRAVFEGPCILGPNLYEVQATVTQELDPHYKSQRILHWRDEAAFFHTGQSAAQYSFGGVCDLGLATTASVEPAPSAPSEGARAR